MGKEQYKTFVNDRLLEQFTPLSEPIKRNKLPLFSRPPAREKSKASLQVSPLTSEGSTLLVSHEIVILMTFLS